MVNKHMEKRSASVIIREVHTKIMMRTDLTPIRMTYIKKTIHNKYWGGYGEKGTFLHMNANWCSYCKKHYGSSSKSLKIKLPKNK